MILFYIRHGDPIYETDSLTPLGERQAEAIGRRLAMFGVDKIYSSTANRTILTAKPACELMKKELALLDFCNEKYAIEEFCIKKNGKNKWFFREEETKYLLADEKIRFLGHSWYEHPKLTCFKKGVERVYNDTYEFLKNLGYEHVRYSGKYKVINSNNERIALFAHHGFGLVFLSTLLDIPLPMFVSHFELGHSGMTVIEFKEENGFSIPKILTMSSDSHLYKADLPMNYNNRIRF